MAKFKGKGAPRKGVSGSQRRASGSEDPMAFKRASRMNKITSADDAGFEGQDAFGMGDDEIALDGNRPNARSGNDDLDEDLDEDEVLSLNLPSRKVPYSADEEDEDEQPTVSKVKKLRLSNKDRDLAPLEPKTKTRRFEKPKASTSKAILQEDENEDVASEDDDDEDSAGGNDKDADDDFDDEWARTGGYHVSRREIENAEARAASASGKPFSNEQDEQTEQLELYEARRIQKEAKEKLAQDDYFDDEELAVGEQDGEDSLALQHAERKAVTAVPRFESRGEAIAHLVSKEPELLALLDDFSATSERVPAAEEKLQQTLKTAASDNPKLGFDYLCRDVIAAYLTLVAFYLHVRSHPSYPFAGAKLASTILTKLVKMRESLSMLDDLGLTELPGEERRKDMYIGNGNGDADDDLENMDRESLMARIGELDDDELEALIAERQAMLEQEHLGATQAATGSKRKAISANGHIDGVSEEQPKPKRVRSRSKKQDKATPLLNLQELPVSTKAAAQVAAPRGYTDDFVEPTSLSAAEASEKAGKKKSLRFYTSKIDAASNKRAGAGKVRSGGDDDVPYRSKERARAAALQRQQHTQNNARENADLDSTDFDDADFALARQVNDDAPAEDGYYDLVATSKKASKQARKEAYEDAVLHDRAAMAMSEPLDPNNPRAVNRQIMANKGLTPRRPKSVRNPRVKKRQKYEKAQKKVASMKPVYKGGLGSNQYEGEKTGITSKVVKSRSL